MKRLIVALLSLVLLITVTLVGVSAYSAPLRKVVADSAVSWRQFLNVAGDFAMSGVYLNDKLYLGGYGQGNIYSFLPLTTELGNSGEAVLSMVTFNGEVYATTENNNPDQRTTILKRTANGWVATGQIDGFATYFMTVWNGYLIVMATTDVQGTDLWYSQDGASWKKGQHFNDWLWVPTVYKEELYILGHSGPGYGPGSSKAVKFEGGLFVDVPALTGTPGVVEWQNATEHHGFMFLGAGGWTMARGESTAAVYRFDGTSAVQVLADSNYHEAQAVLSSTYNGFLYVSMGAGFKHDVGDSQLWASKDNGATWINAGHFPNCPQLYVLMDTPYGYVAAGGRQGNLVAYFYDTRPAPPVEPEHTCPNCGYRF